MKIDVKTLTIEELDDLILRAAQERDERKQPMSETPPSIVWMANSPPWLCDAFGDGILLRLRHPGYGWTNFMFPRNFGAALCSALLCNLLGNTVANAQPVVAMPGPAGTSGPKH